MSIINPNKLKRELALHIIFRHDRKYHVLANSDLFRHAEKLGYYWDEAEQDWRVMPENKVQDER